MDKKDKPISDLHKSLQLLAKKLTFDEYKKLKASLSGKILAEKLMLSEAMLFDFEESLRQYFQFRISRMSSRMYRKDSLLVLHNFK